MAGPEHRPRAAETLARRQRQSDQNPGHASVSDLVPMPELEPNTSRGAHVPEACARLRLPVQHDRRLGRPRHKRHAQRGGAEDVWRERGSGLSALLRVRGHAHRASADQRAERPVRRSSSAVESVHSVELEC